MHKYVVILLVATLGAAGCRNPERKAAVARKAPAKTAAAAPATTAPAPSPHSTEVGSMMPAYKAVWLDGKEFDIAAEKGNVVFLNLWATWCAPCRYEIPELEVLHQKYAARGFKVVGVSIDDSGPDVVKNFVAEKKMTYPVALDSEGRLANVFETSIIPTSVVIDRSGRIVWKYFGAVTPGDAGLIKAIESALASKS